MIGLMIEPGIASWKTAGFNNASGRYRTGYGRRLSQWDGPPRPVVFLARAWRERPGERFDAAALDVDNRHCGHANHGVLEQSVPDAKRPVLLAANVESATDVVPSRVAGGRLLRQRLQ